MPMAEHSGILYIVSTDEIFRSGDKGETWRAMGSRPKGHAVGFIIIDAEARAHNSQARSTMYLALRGKGIYRSTDGGARWYLFNDGLTNKRISAVAAVEKTVFAGTASGLYRLDSGTWKRLPVETSRAVYSLAVSESNLYVGTGPHLLGFTPIGVEQEVPKVESHALKVFHSADFGVSWTEITPDYKSDDRVIPSGMTVFAGREMILVSTAKHQYRSTDNGQTWRELQGDTDMLMINRLPAVVVNETTFYKAGPFGIFRTTDGGKLWPLLTDGMVGTRLQDLIVFNNRLYAHTGFAVYQSIDEGVSWKKLSADDMHFVKVTTTESLEPDKTRVYTFFDTKLVVDDNNLYFISPEVNNLQISRVSTDGDIRSPVQNIPASDDIVSIAPPPISEKDAKVRIVAVCNDVFYAEQERRLFKWKLGDLEWTNTGLTDKSQLSYEDLSKELKLAVSGETLYVGKRDGKLFQSLDGGSSWRDVTPNLPLDFADFKEITLVGSTVYVATDEGVLSSETGVHWRVLTDSAGKRPIIDRFAVDGPTIYGVGDSGAYRLDTPKQWQQISSEPLGETVALAVINDKLYSAIKDRGMFHISIAEE